ncbi:MAG: DUF3326 domain-containing protein [Elainellaceae cyanobacterium]
MLIVPTGIGAAVGGYAGDALPVAKAVAQISDHLITHPNVLNGAQLYWPMDNVLYVEGYGLDRFAAGIWGLQPVRQNRVGLLLDAAIETDLRLRHLQAADATRATLGLTLTDYVVTDAPLGVTLKTSASGATWGTIERPDSLLRGVEALVDTAGAEAIAVVARFPDDEGSDSLQAYRQGYGVDPLAGAEAVISHLVVEHFGLPCAHAPALEPLPPEPSISPRAAAEELGYTFLPCVLVGLSRAPQFVSKPQSTVGTMLGTSTLWANDVDAVIVPASACGGSATLSLGDRQTTIIAVQENSTRMVVSPAAVGLPAISVESYLEALGVLVALKAGLQPMSLRPHIAPLRQLQRHEPDPL